MIRWPGQCQRERLASSAFGRGQRGQTGQPRGLPGVAADGLRQVGVQIKTKLLEAVTEAVIHNRAVLAFIYGRLKGTVA